MWYRCWGGIASRRAGDGISDPILLCVLFCLTSGVTARLKRRRQMDAASCWFLSFSPPLPSFQYAILMTMVLTIFIKYILHSIDLQSENPWDNKAVYMLYTELFTGNDCCLPGRKWSEACFWNPWANCDDWPKARGGSVFLGFLTAALFSKKAKFKFGSANSLGNRLVPWLLNLGKCGPNPDGQPIYEQKGVHLSVSIQYWEYRIVATYWMDVPIKLLLE